MHFDELGGYWACVTPPQLGKPIRFDRRPVPFDDDPADCPFCPGNEAACGIETARRGQPWQVRAVENRWPVTERHEVVVLTPDHHGGIYAMGASQWALAFDLMAERVATMPGGDALVFVNHGREAGASLPHAHAQIVGFDPPHAAPAAERTACAAGRCVLCRIGHSPPPTTVHAPDHATGGWVTWVPPAPRLGGEIRVAAGDHGGTWDAAGLGAALADVLAAIAAAAGPVACNLVVHAWRGGHLHLHVYPRFETMTVYDLGWGVPVCLIDTDDWVARLRAGWPTG
jgi:UDPglucose--hexose-1-phosphate uridylyltransferase